MLLGTLSVYLRRIPLHVEAIRANKLQMQKYRERHIDKQVECRKNVRRQLTGCGTSSSTGGIIIDTDLPALN
jgi:hypothetical protein